MTSTPVIEAQHLTLEYRLDKQWVTVIRDVTLQINPTEIHGLVGESGSGKSTLALALMRYLAKNARIVSGDIRFDGQSLLTASPSDMRRIWGRDMSLVPQDPLAALNPSFTVGDQIAEINVSHNHTSYKQAWRDAVDMLAKVRIADPESVARKYPHQLSGGMQQRVTIAMALTTRPRLLVLDEPTTALDVTTEATILDLFRDLIHDNQAAALYVSHNLGVIAQMCDRVTVLYGGEVMASAAVNDIFSNPVHPYTINLLASIPKPMEGVQTRLPTMEGVAPSLADRPTGCVFAPRCPIALPLCHQQKPPLEWIDSDRTVKCHRWHDIASGNAVLEDRHESIFEPIKSGDAGTVLNTRHLTKQYGSASLLDRLFMRASRRIQAVDDVSIKIRAQATLGLVGESGSGKTTLARCILGLETADTGEITLLDLPISRTLSSRPQQVKRDMQMVFQNPTDTLNPYQTIGHTLERTIRLLNTEPLNRNQIRLRVSELLKLVRLPLDYAERYPGELSGGEKQRVAIARAFAANPALVVADEPTSALDVSVQAVILNLLKDLRAKEGAAYLFISHDLRAVSYLADWLMVMYLGQIIEEGPTNRVYNIPSHPYTEALISAIPEPDPTIKQRHIRLEGEIPSSTNLPSGCRFHTRCPRKIGRICEQQEPPWRDAGDDHYIRCHISIDDLIELQTLPSPATVVSV